MKVAFTKTHDYICHNCDIQFNWNKESRSYGKLEYKTISEEKERKVFCSKSCGEEFINNNQ